MGLEVADYISQLDATNPVGATDPKSQGDDHLRLLKHVLQTQFSALGTEAVTATAAQINAVAAAGPYVPVFANPAAQVGLAVVNGAAATFMRSDAAPALRQDIAPVWTSQHIFTNQVSNLGGLVSRGTGYAQIGMQALSGATNEKVWTFANVGTTLRGVYYTDDLITSKDWLNVQRSGMTLQNVSFGNGDNPIFNFLGTGDAAFSGRITTTLGGTRIQGPMVVRAVEAGTILTTYISLQDAGNNERGWMGYGGGTNVLSIVNGTAGATLRLVAAGGGAIDMVCGGVTSSGGITAPSFSVSSSRMLKRETGTPYRTGEILSRLRPILYKLLADGDGAREQYGLIAEEVHSICPQLSDGKTVMYDRLAVMLLAAWQEDHAHG